MTAQLEIEDLAISSEHDRGWRRITAPLSLSLARGGTLAIVGESGSGKSLTVKAIAGLLPPGVGCTGSIRLDGEELLGRSERELQRVRGGRISMLLQDPFTMLNPVMRCGAHIEEMLRHQPGFRRRSALRAEVVRRLAEVGISDPSVADQMPFQLSGGMCQRVALAAALARDPEILIADEPSTALDVTTQAEIMALLGEAQAQRGMTLILVTHDLRLAFSQCERVCVLYAGSLIEAASSAELSMAPAHPYTSGLLLSEPPHDRRLDRLVGIPGRVPPAHMVEHECSFADRCDWVQDRCRTGKPALIPRARGRLTACIRQPEIQAELDALRTAVEAGAPPPPSPARAADPIVAIRDLGKTFTGRRTTHALKGVSLEIGRGESVGLVGESGSGKTTLGRCLVGLETPSGGTITVDGIPARDVDSLDRASRARLRRTVQMVFQDPYSTLNPRHSVGVALKEALRLTPGGAVEAEVDRLLREVGLTAEYRVRRPAELSGGERQRVAIARALAVDPAVLVCDEPVSALDVSVQAQVINLLNGLKRTRGLSLLFITHDLAVVRQIADRVCVLYLGENVEHGPVDEVLTAPRHPYTRRLLASVPGATRREGCSA